ncbi:hypothetical protein HAX54_045874 [Datura stramonium]|uniref:Uncharacterized protein n=1 Tax=Datura stramonium TaxID=4076 RepID=A0ABS8WII6_DATST|nr:hypothetical protein [Datura stramonium]
MDYCNYQLAITFQEKAIEAWEGHGPSAVDELKEAHRLLEQLKKKAFGVSDGTLMKALPLANSSESGFSSTSQVGVSAIERQRNATKMLNQ